MKRFTGEWDELSAATEVQRLTFPCWSPNTGPQCLVSVHSVTRRDTVHRCIIPSDMVVLTPLEPQSRFGGKLLEI